MKKRLLTCGPRTLTAGVTLVRALFWKAWSPVGYWLGGPLTVQRLASDRHTPEWLLRWMMSPYRREGLGAVGRALAQNPRLLKQSRLRWDLTADLPVETVIVLFEKLSEPDRSEYAGAVLTRSRAQLSFLDYLEAHPDVRLELGAVDVAWLLRSPLPDKRRQVLLMLPRLSAAAARS